MQRNIVYACFFVGILFNQSFQILNEPKYFILFC